ncbi:MAG: hypothetical protein ACK5JD_04520 [Mangrovibacterium sp.]
MVSCDKDENVKLSDAGYLVFGHFYGECVGERCVEIFRLEKDKLFEDTEDQYPYGAGFYAGNFVQLSAQKFDGAKDLVNYFPAELLNEPDNIIGLPDAGDWGGLYIEYNYNGIRKRWLLDQMKSNVPEKYHSFIDKVNEKIAQLQ